MRERFRGNDSERLNLPKVRLPTVLTEEVPSGPLAGLPRLVGMTGDMPLKLKRQLVKPAFSVKVISPGKIANFFKRIFNTFLTSLNFRYLSPHLLTQIINFSANGRGQLLDRLKD